jgi:hypothetical protein
VCRRATSTVTPHAAIRGRQPCSLSHGEATSGDRRGFVLRRHTEGWSGRTLTQARTCCANMLNDDAANCISFFDMAMQVFMLYKSKQYILVAVYLLLNLPNSIFILNLCISAANVGCNVCAQCAANQILLRRCTSPNRNMQTSPLLLPSIPLFFVLYHVSIFLYSLRILEKKAMLRSRSSVRPGAGHPCRGVSYVPASSCIFMTSWWCSRNRPEFECCIVVSPLCVCIL